MQFEMTATPYSNLSLKLQIEILNGSRGKVVWNICSKKLKREATVKTFNKTCRP